MRHNQKFGHRTVLRKNDSLIFVQRIDYLLPMSNSARLLELEFLLERNGRLILHGSIIFSDDLRHFLVSQVAKCMHSFRTEICAINVHCTSIIDIHISLN